MAITNKQLEIVNTDLLLVPAEKRYAVTAIMICNTENPDPLDENAGTVSLDMHFIPTGEPKSTLNMVLNTLELRAGETFSFDTEKIILDAGDRVTMVATPDIDYPPVVAGSFQVGKRYEITSVNDTDFTLIGASDNIVGIIFNATGAGTGTGEAKLSGYTSLTATASYLEL
jgi:hypothetical protein